MKAAEAGAGKVSLLHEDPLRYLLRAVGAGMGLSVVEFTFWVLKQNPHDISIGATSNNMYLLCPLAKVGRVGDRPRCCYFGNLVGAILVAVLLLGAGSLGQLPVDHALFDGALNKAQQTGSVIFVKGILANWIVCLVWLLYV